MSNEVYGYFECNDSINEEEFFDYLERKTNIGIKAIPLCELYGFPKDRLPKETEKCTAFIIGDRPGKTNASYLVDYLDYAPEADIGLPCKGKMRIRLLVEFIGLMMCQKKIYRFSVAITDSSQIDEVKTVDIAHLESVLIADFEECAPPNCLYNIVRGSD